MPLHTGTVESRLTARGRVEVQGHLRDLGTGDVEREDHLSSELVPSVTQVQHLS